MFFSASSYLGIIPVSDGLNENVQSFFPCLPDSFRFWRNGSAFRRHYTMESVKYQFESAFCDHFLPHHTDRAASWKLHKGLPPISCDFLLRSDTRCSIMTVLTLYTILCTWRKPRWKLSKDKVYSLKLETKDRDFDYITIAKYSNFVSEEGDQFYFAEGTKITSALGVTQIKLVKVG